MVSLNLKILTYRRLNEFSPIRLMAGAWQFLNSERISSLSIMSYVKVLSNAVLKL